MTKQEISDMIRDSLKQKLVGKPCPDKSNKIITDITVSFSDDEIYNDDGSLSGYYENLYIEYRSKSAKTGKDLGWSRLYLN